MGALHMAQGWLMSVALVACGATSAPVADTDGPPSTAPLTSAGRGSMGDGLGIQSQQVDGVWLFWHQTQDHEDALLTGPATISEGCLRVGGSVVVWHESRLSEARAAVDALAARRTLEDLAVGGSAMTATLAMASGLTDECSGSPVWLGSPTEASAGP